jgi:adenosylhomocysteine nucleosidase
VKNREFRKRLSEYGINNPKMMLGDIASGDLFVSGVEMRRDLIRNLPSVVCVEMEGAAVAQVCYDFDVPLIVVRVISDTADEQAHTSAIGFVNQHAGEYSLAILKEYLHLLD